MSGGILMIIVISDLHFSDCTVSVNVLPEVFSNILFPQILSKLTTTADKDIKEIHFVLNGDIFDLVSTDKFLKLPPENRPWNGILDPDYAVNIDTDVVSEYEKVFDDITKQPGCNTFINQIHKLNDSLNIPLKISYIIGNHDRVINLYEPLKQKVKEIFAPVSVEIVNSLHSEKYSLLCRHGHEWDKTCFGYEFARKVLHKSYDSRFNPEFYKVQNIGEVVTSELMGGIIYRLNYEFQWKGKHDNIIENIKEINNVRPVHHALDWLVWTLSQELSQTLKENIASAIYDSITAFLNTSLAISWDKLTPDLIFSGDIVDRIQLLQKSLKKNDFRSFKSTLKLIKIAEILPEFKNKIYLKGAIEDFVKFPDLQFVVYGHTHYAKEIVIESTQDDPPKMYINTGTYLPLIQKATLKGYGIAKKMTITFIYSKNEDNKNKKPQTNSIEFWNGTKQKEYNK